MARTRYSELFGVLGILIVITNLVTVIQSDENEGVIVTEQELYEIQKQAFGDSLGYGYSEDNGNKRLNEPHVPTEDKRSHIDDKQGIRKRSADGSDPYGLIAGISGGSVIHTDKGNISSAVDILTTTTLTNPAIVTRTSFKMTNSSQIPFYVDKSLTKLAVEIKTSCCKPTVVVTDASGTNLTTASPNVTLKVDTSTLSYIDIARTLIPGKWTLSVSSTSSQEYDVTIHGSSLVNFDLDFSDSMGITISGQPIPDSSSTYVKVTPIGADMVSNWTSLLIKAINGTILHTLSLGALKGSRTSRAFLLPVTWPSMDVHVGVLGLDKDKNTFTRERRTLVQPLGVRLLLDKAGAEFITSCNKPFNVSFTITNTGSSSNFTCQVTIDNTNFVASISPTSVSLTSHGTSRGQAIVTLKTTPKSDYTVQIVISVIDSSMKAQYVTKTLIAKHVVCPDTATYTYVTPSSTSSSATVISKTGLNVWLLKLTLLLAHLWVSVA